MHNTSHRILQWKRCVSQASASVPLALLSGVAPATAKSPVQNACSNSENSRKMISGRCLTRYEGHKWTKEYNSHAIPCSQLASWLTGRMEDLGIRCELESRRNDAPGRLYCGT